MRPPRRMLRTLLGLVLASSLAACQRTTYRTALEPGGFLLERNLDYYALGLVGEHEVDLAELCPHGVHAFRTEAPMLGLFDFVTLGVYTPRRLVVECAGAPR